MIGHPLSCSGASYNAVRQSLLNARPAYLRPAPLYCTAHTLQRIANRATAFRQSYASSRWRMARQWGYLSAADFKMGNRGQIKRNV